MPHRNTLRHKLAHWSRALAYLVFVAAGVFYIAYPPLSSEDFFNSTAPSIIWGVIFSAGGLVSGTGLLQGVPHTERFGLTLVVIAGAILTINQTALMFDEPVTLTRGGGTLAYAAFALLALSMALQLGDKIGPINVAARIKRRAEEDGS